MFSTSLVHVILSYHTKILFTSIAILLSPQNLFFKVSSLKIVMFILHSLWNIYLYTIIHVYLYLVIFIEKNISCIFLHCWHASLRLIIERTFGIWKKKSFVIFQDIILKCKKEWYWLRLICIILLKFQISNILYFY